MKGLRSHFWMVLAVALGAAACGGNATVVPGVDSGRPPGDAAGDTGRPTGDTGTATGDTGRPTGDTGMTMSGGECGDAVVTCLCGCGANATCQQGCLGRSAACPPCYVGAIQGCCPMEAQAFGTCGSMSGCAMNDQACLQMRCGTQFNALNTCFARAQMSDMACQQQLATCFGSYPLRCM